MSNIAASPILEVDDDRAETAALNAAIAESDSDPRTIPHAEMRAWLLKLSEGDFEASPPEPR